MAGTFVASVPVRYHRSGEPEADVARLMPIRRGSALHRTCVELFQRHRGGSDGLCGSCQEPVPCSSRIFAAGAIEMAGDSPQIFDEPQPGPELRVAAPGGGDAERRAVLPAPSAAVTGYALGGAGRRQLPDAGWDYER
jgi:hypothetical protein